MKATSPREMLAKYGLAPLRGLGQHFLSDPNVAAKVADAVGASAGDVVLEIGPGFGAITLLLAERAGRVVAVEFDEGIAAAFAEEYGEPARLRLVVGDFLSFDIGGAVREEGVSDLLVAGNLPYNVTSPVLRRLIEHRAVVRRAVLMVQDEVGKRLVARPGGSDYSALSVVCQYHAAVRSLFGVRRTCFHPRPAVDSRVVELDLRAGPARAADDELFARVVHAAFGKRRKMLRGSLRDLAAARGVPVGGLAEESGIDLSRRAESLSVPEFEALALALDRGEPGREEEPS